MRRWCTRHTLPVYPTALTLSSSIPMAGTSINPFFPTQKTASGLATQRAILIEACFARMVKQAWILPMRHTRHGIDYGPQLGGVTLARCGWMDFRKLWLRP
ncbi:MAG: hypothetical protein V4495_26855 [Pseudomonadota bacterium]